MFCGSASSSEHSHAPASQDVPGIAWTMWTAGHTQQDSSSAQRARGILGVSMTDSSPLSTAVGADQGSIGLLLGAALSPKGADDAVVAQPKTLSDLQPASLEASIDTLLSGPRSQSLLNTLFDGVSGASSRPEHALPISAASIPPGNGAAPGAAAGAQAAAEQQLLQELASLLAEASTPRAAASSLAALQGLLPPADDANAACTKLQLLQQLQVLIAQQQQQLQLQLHAQHSTPLLTGPRSASFSGTAGSTAAGPFAATGSSVLGLPALRPAHSGIAAAFYSDVACADVACARDQGAHLLGLGAAGGLPACTDSGWDPICTPPGRLLELQLHQQQLQLQRAATTPRCADFTDTPTALATLPPGLLEEVVGVDASARVIRDQWAYSKACAATSPCSTDGSAPTTMPAASQLAAHANSGSRLSRVSGPLGSSSLPARPAEPCAFGGSAALQLQLQQAIDQLAALHITTHAPPAPAAPQGLAGKVWDWGSVDDLLRSDSATSKGSINRTSSSGPSDSSAGSTLWGEGASLGVLGPLLSGSVALQAPHTLLSTPPGLNAALRRTLSTASATSSTCDSSVGQAAHRSARLAGRSSSGGGVGAVGMPGSMAPGAVDQAVGGHAASKRAASSSGSKQGRPQASSGSVDSLLERCAPKWAKAGWDPKASVTATPAAATKGTGAFVRLNAAAPSGACGGTSAAAAAVMEVGCRRLPRQQAVG